MKNIFKIKYFCVIILIGILYTFLGYNILNYKEGRLSEEENRYLKSFPKISFDMIKNRSFSKEIESFLTDNVYNRSIFIDISKKIKHYYSINNILKDDSIIFINNDININDDLNKNNNISKDFTNDDTKEIKKENNILNEEIDENIDIIGNLDAAEKSSYIFYQNEAYNVSHLSNDGRAYSIKTINRLKRMFNDKIFTVMVSPTKSCLITDKKVIDAIGDQKTEISHFVKKFNYGINTIDLSDTFLENKDKYIFYKSDHHWTQLGAYYAYREYMKTMYRPYTELDKLKHEIMEEDWKGVAYKVTKSERFKNLSDTVENYYSNKYCTMITCYSSENFTIDYTTISNKNAGYDRYCGVKGSIKIIDVPANNKNDVLLITGDSFCDAIVPILVENYGRIIYIDSRKANDDMYKVALKFGVNLDDVKEVLVLCNFDSYNNSYVSSKMDYGFGLSKHIIYKNKDEYFEEFFKDLYNYLINYNDMKLVFNQKNIYNEIDFINNLKNIKSDIDYNRSNDLLRAISYKLAYNNDYDKNLIERSYEESFLGYCIKNSYYLRLFNYLSDKMKYSYDLTESIIKLYHSDIIPFNMIK